MRLARIIFVVVSSGWACVYLSRSGLRPGPFNPPNWYDRTLRVIGGALMGCVSVGILVMALAGKL
jgi:hypothetical protein